MEINKKQKIKPKQKMNMKNKKSQVFTTVGIVIIMLFVASTYITLDKGKGIRDRIKSMDSFRFSMEENIRRQLYIAGFRIIFLTNDRITQTGEYISDFESIFQEGIWNGTIVGEEKEVLEDTTIDDIEKAIQNEADKINVNVNITDKEAFIRQDSPWTVTVGLNFTLHLSDKSGLAERNKNESIKASIGVQNFEDPIYFVSTNGIISSKINKTIYEGNYVTNGNTTNLSKHTEGGLYTSNPNAPSFIQRLEGDFSSSEQGIESLVYLPELSQQGLSTKEKTITDHIYFSNNDPTSYNIEGMSNWFRIDNLDNRTKKYRVENLTE